MTVQDIEQPVVDTEEEQRARQKQITKIARWTLPSLVFCKSCPWRIFSARRASRRCTSVTDEAILLR